MRTSKLAAAATALSLFMVGVALLVSADPANAVNSTLRCRLYFGDAGTGSSATTYNDTFTFTQTPSSPGPNTTVNVSLVGQQGPLGGPAIVDAASEEVLV